MNITITLRTDVIIPFKENGKIMEEMTIPLITGNTTYNMKKSWRKYKLITAFI